MECDEKYSRRDGIEDKGAACSLHLMNSMDILFIMVFISGSGQYSKRKKRQSNDETGFFKGANREWLDNMSSRVVESVSNGQEKM